MSLVGRKFKGQIPERNGVRVAIRYQRGEEASEGRGPTYGNRREPDAQRGSTVAKPEYSHRRRWHPEAALCTRGGSHAS